MAEHVKTRVANVGRGIRDSFVKSQSAERIAKMVEGVLDQIGVHACMDILVDTVK